MNDLDYLSHLRRDSLSMSRAVGEGSLDAPIEGCPGWDLRQLAEHVGFVHRWAYIAAASAAPTAGEGIEPAPLEQEELVVWVGAGGASLADLLESIDPLATTWHPFPGPRHAVVWRRRMAQETSIHRWDAQHAVRAAGSTSSNRGAGSPEPGLDTELAADGIDEHFTRMLERRLTRPGADPTVHPPIGGALRVRCTDHESEWKVSFDGDAVSMEVGPVGAASTVSGSAEQLLLALWGRVDTESLEITGDVAHAHAWIQLSGS